MMPIDLHVSFSIICSNSYLHFGSLREITACSYVTACEQAAIQDVKYDFTADLTGTGDGSLYEIGLCETYFTYVVLHRYGQRDVYTCVR